MDPIQHGKMFHAVFATAPLAIAIAEAEGRFLDVNQAFLSMLGYSREEALRLTFMDITHPDDRAETLSLVQKVRKGEMNSYQVEKRYVGRDGGSIWAIARITVQRDENGAIQYWLGIMEDITERRRAQAECRRLATQLQQAQKMEAIGTLAGGIAHDFNNLLMGIQGNISLLMLDKPPDHRDLVYLKNIEKSVMRGSELTRQILGFARGGKYDVKTTDLNALVEKTAEMFGRSRKEITIRCNLQPDLWPVEVDQTQLQQVLLNLMVNAWQAMPGGGDLLLDTTNVTVDAHFPDRPPDAAPGSYVRVQITDTGVGMDPATLAHIFEPFFTTREKGHGTGLGLSSAFGIVKSHNGFMTVRSRKGSGSTFGVLLPAAVGREIRNPNPARSSSPGGKVVLLVEDEEMVADIGCQMLERLGFRTLVARSGDEAIQLYEQRREEIALVILDMIMPGLGGEAVFDRIRAIHPEALVMLSSGYSLNEQAQAILKRGGRGFIQKPFSLEQLERKIREVLSSGREPSR